MTKDKSIGSVWVRIILVLTIGWVLFGVLFDTFSGRVPAFGPGNYSNVTGGLSQAFFLVSVQLLAITLFISILVYLASWLRDEYKFYKFVRQDKEKNK